MLTTNRVEAGSVTLDYFEDGPADADRTMVLIHSASSSARIWEQVQHHLAEAGTRTVAISMRGAGGSHRSEDEADYQPAVYAADVAAAVRALDLDRFVLVGHSLGVSNVTMYMRDHNADRRVTGLVLMAGGALTARPTPSAEDMAKFDADRARTLAEDARARYERWEPNHLGLADDTRRQLWRDLEANPPQRPRGQRLAARPDLTPVLAALEVPTLVIAGDADGTVPIEATVRGFLALPDGRRHLHVFHGVSHFPNAQVPDRVAGVFTRFMQAHVPMEATAK
ncbi:MAG: alpha/beta hydrolase [Dehalococcoidia bacterium]